VIIGDRRGAIAEWLERQTVGAGIEVRARRLGNLLAEPCRTTALAASPP
jgi:hypothetical protein